MMAERFDPQELTHWLLIGAYFALSIWVLKKVYLG